MSTNNEVRKFGEPFMSLLAYPTGPTEITDRLERDAAREEALHMKIKELKEALLRWRVAAATLAVVMWWEVFWRYPW